MRLLSLITVLILTLTACNLGTVATTSDETSTTDIPPIPDQQQTIAYWQAVGVTEFTPTEDDYVFIDQLVLRRITLDTDPSSDVSSDLQRALSTMLSSQNIWQAVDVSLDTVTVEGDLATIAMSGQIQAVGGAILSIVPTQFLLTIFEQPILNRAVITLNGQTLYNIGIANDTQARPADFVYTREAFFNNLSQN